MFVLGVDPGTRHLGWGVVEARGTRLIHVAHGVIHASAVDLVDRLIVIDDAFRLILQNHPLTEAGVESLFFAKDPLAAAKLGHARGVILLALKRANIGIFEYPPATVKRAVACSGRAEKTQVAGMVRALLGLESNPPLDASDALAVAITHVRTSPARAIAALAARSR